VQARTGHSARSARYVYFHNTAEQGIFYGRPLVAVDIDGGTIYLNSGAQAFVDDESFLAKELGAADGILYLAAGKPLRLVGQW